MFGCRKGTKQMTSSEQVYLVVRCAPSEAEGVKNSGGSDAVVIELSNHECMRNLVEDFIRATESGYDGDYATGTRDNPSYAHAAWRSFEDRLKMRGWDVMTPTGCWEIRGSKHRQGYGLLKVKGSTKFAHRIAYEAWVGPIPEGLVVRHKCDNPPCINPDHLEVGTQKDNAVDRETRGRRNPARGSRSGAAKLTEDSVSEIKRLLRAGVNQQEIANRFNVSRAAVTSIKTGKTWRHVK